jgi:hypothetical protein
MALSLLATPSYIHKPTALIHFERDLSVVAQKVMTLIVAHCQKETKNDQGFYLIEKRRVCELLGWEASCNHLRVVEAFDEIYNNSLIWNLFRQDRTFKYLKCRLIVSLLIPAETGSSVGFQLHPELEPIIKFPKVYGQILLEVPALLARSEYAFPLYELLADHVSREEGLLRITLADLKRYLGINGSYPAFPMFRTRVLTPSLNSINNSTDLQISYETWRDRQAVVGLSFRIQRDKRQSSATTSPKAPEKALVVRVALPPTPPPSVPTWSPEEQAFLDRLVRHQISEEDAIQAVQTHGLNGAQEIFGYVRQEVARRKGTTEEIRNVSAYLARCLREGFGRKGEADREAEIVQAARAEQATAAQSAADNARAEANAAVRTQTTVVMDRFTALPIAEQIALEQAFLQAEPIWGYRPANTLSRSKAFQSWLVQQWL